MSSFLWLTNISYEEVYIMPKDNKYDQKHLTTSQRIKVEKGLNDGKSFAEIGRIVEGLRRNLFQGYLFKAFLINISQ